MDRLKDISRLLNLRSLAALALVALVAFVPTLSAQEKKKDKDEPARGTPVLWRAPVDIVTRDLYLGPGGEAMRPDLRKVTFLKDETGGYSTKFRVKDASGR